MAHAESALRAIAQLERRSPGAVRLATLSSLAIRTETQLIRELRLSLLPGLEVGSEADLWFSALVTGRGPSGIVLDRDVAGVLLKRIASDFGTRTRHRARDLVQTAHTGMAPTLLLEEEVRWLSLSGDDESINSQLTKALALLAEERKPELAAWWLQARTRLPESATSLDVVADLDLLAAVVAGVTTDGDRQRSVANALEQAGTTRVLARRGRKGIQIGNFRPDSRTVALSVPNVAPITLSLAWEDGKASVSFDRSDSTTAAVGTGPASITTAAGQVYELGIGDSVPDRSETMLAARIVQALANAVLTPDAVEISPGSSRAADETDLNRQTLLEVSGRAFGNCVSDYADPQWKRARRALARIRPELAEVWFDDLVLELAGAPRPNVVTKVTKPPPRLDEYQDPPRSDYAPETADSDLLDWFTDLGYRLADQFGVDSVEASVGEWAAASVQPAWWADNERLTDSGVWQQPKRDVREFFAALGEELARSIDSLPELSSPLTLLLSTPATELLHLHFPDQVLDLQPDSVDSNLVTIAVADVAGLLNWFQEWAAAGLTAVLGEAEAPSPPDRSPGAAAFLGSNAGEQAALVLQLGNALAGGDGVDEWPPELPPTKELLANDTPGREEVARSLGIELRDLESGAATESIRETTSEIVDQAFANPSRLSAAALLEAMWVGEHELVRVAAALSLANIHGMSDGLRSSLEEALRSDDPTVVDLARQGLRPDGVEEEPERKQRPRRGAPPRQPAVGAAVLVHGTFAAKGTWYRPGGDLYDFLAKSGVITLHDTVFRWTGVYSRSARDDAARRLIEWVRDQGLVQPSFIAGGHGGSVVNAATRMGLEIDTLVLLSWPVSEADFPEFARVNRVVDIRVRRDLVIMADRGGQRFRVPDGFANKVEAHVNGWFNSSATTTSDYWIEHDLLSIVGPIPATLQPDPATLQDKVVIDTYERLRQIVVELLGADLSQISETTQFVDDLQMDSLDAVELTMEIEDVFEIQIADSEVEELPETINLAQAARLIAGKLPEAAS